MCVGGWGAGSGEFFPLNRMSNMKDAFVGKSRGGVSERLEPGHREHMESLGFQSKGSRSH